MALSFLLFISLLFIGAQSDQGVYGVSTAFVGFKSDAPFELIQAKTTSVRGVIDIDKSTFAFEVKVSAFEGFNSPLQKEHFNENYMETSKYPYARFFGKMIGKFDTNVIGTYTVEAVGTLDIHGIKKERKIEVTIEVGSGKALDASSQFDVLLYDHNIKVPSIVRQKIAEKISIDFFATLISKKN